MFWVWTIVRCWSYFVPVRLTFIIYRHLRINAFSCYLSFFFLFSTNFVAVARTQCLVAMFGFSSEFLTSERQVDLFVTTFYMRVSLSLGWMKLSSPKLSWFFHNYVRPWLRHNALNAKYIELALQCLAMSKFVLEKIGPKKLPQQNILIVRLPQQGQPMPDFFS